MTGVQTCALPIYASAPEYEGVVDALKEVNTDIRIFGKPTTRPNRRMAVALVSDKLGTEISWLIEKAKSVAAKVKLKY